MERNYAMKNELAQGREIRIYWYDNAKFWLITLVVVAHFLPGPTFAPILAYNNHFLQTVEIIIFMFVMQAFVFISGAFSKDTLTNEYLQKSIMQLIVPYVIIGTIAKIIAGQYTPGYLLEPPPIMWYLIALFVWRLALVVVKQFRWPIILSIFCALAVGYESKVESFFSLSRIFTFFPFFLLGHFYGDKMLQIQFKYQRIVGISVFIIAFLAIWNYFPITPLWLLMNTSYVALGADGFSGVFIRLSLMIVSFILAFAFFLIMTKQKTKVSEWGTRSIYVYILHPFIVLGFLKLGFYDNPPLVLQLMLIPLSLLCAIILSSKLIEKIFSTILFPSFIKKLFVPIHSDQKFKGK